MYRHYEIIVSILQTGRNPKLLYSPCLGASQMTLGGHAGAKRLLPRHRCWHRRLGMFVSAKIKQVAAVVGLGWVTVLSPSVAHAQPPHITQEGDITCPDIAGINYVRDANDSRAFYLCVDGEQKHHFRCPQITLLIMAMPPKCLPLR